MEANPYIFNLSKAVEYSKDGEFQKTATLEFMAPVMSDFELASELSQLVMRATLDARQFAEESTEEGQKDDSEINADAVRMILFASKSVKFSEVAEVFKKLAGRIGTVDGKTKLTPGVINKLSISDFTEVICGYIANFIFPSLFSGGGE